MKVNWAVDIAGIGMAVPPGVMTNDDWVRRLDTSDEWIVQRTGIRERRVAGPQETTLSLSAAASREALRDAGAAPDEVDLIICATITPDYLLPSTSCELQAALGCRRVAAFDLAAACSGFVYGLITAAQSVCAGMSRCALVIGADTITRSADWEDRQSAVLFGDGAGAVIVRPDSTGRRGIRAARMGADGSRAKLIWIPAGGSALPSSTNTVNERLHVMRMRGRDVYRFAVVQMEECIRETLADAGLTMDDVALVIPHQSNLRIIESACEKLDLPHDKVFVNIDRFGNTSAASVPIAFYEAWRSGRVKRGDRIMLVALGAGLTWASVLLEL